MAAKKKARRAAPKKKPEVVAHVKVGLPDTGPNTEPKPNPRTFEEGWHAAKLDTFIRLAESAISRDEEFRVSSSLVGLVLPIVRRRIAELAMVRASEWDVRYTADTTSEGQDRQFTISIAD